MKDSEEAPKSFEDGFKKGFEDGREDGCVDGYVDGLYKGFKMGFYKGLEQGSKHSEVDSEEVSKMDSEDGFEDGFEKGFEKGLEDGYIITYSDSYVDGLGKGFGKGFKEGFEQGLEGSEEDSELDCEEDSEMDCDEDSEMDCEEDSEMDCEEDSEMDSEMDSEDDVQSTRHYFMWNHGINTYGALDKKTGAFYRAGDAVLSEGSHAIICTGYSVIWPTAPVPWALAYKRNGSENPDQVSITVGDAGQQQLPDDKIVLTTCNLENDVFAFGFRSGVEILYKMFSYIRPNVFRCAMNIDHALHFHRGWAGQIRKMALLVEHITPTLRSCEARNAVPTLVTRLTPENFPKLRCLYLVASTDNNCKHGRPIDWPGVQLNDDGFVPFPQFLEHHPQRVWDRYGHPDCMCDLDSLCLFDRDGDEPFVNRVRQEIEDLALQDFAHEEIVDYGDGPGFERDEDITEEDIANAFVPPGGNLVIRHFARETFMSLPGVTIKVVIDPYRC